MSKCEIRRFNFGALRLDALVRRKVEHDLLEYGIVCGSITRGSILPVLYLELGGEDQDLAQLRSTWWVPPETLASNFIIEKYLTIDELLTHSFSGVRQYGLQRREYSQAF